MPFAIVHRVDGHPYSYVELPIVQRKTMRDGFATFEPSTFTASGSLAVYVELFAGATIDTTGVVGIGAGVVLEVVGVGAGAGVPPDAPTYVKSCW